MPDHRRPRPMSTPASAGAPAMRGHATAYRGNASGAALRGGASVPGTVDAYGRVPARADVAPVVSTPGRDAEIAARVRDVLAGDDDVAVQHLSVLVRTGVVTLRGRVGSREAARLAEGIVEDLQGVADVINELAIDHALQSR